MKHLLTTLFAVFITFTAANAQESTSTNTQQEKVLTKEEKAAQKAQKEANLQETFKAAGLTAEEQQMVRTSLEARSAYKKELKADTSLTEEEFNIKYKKFTSEEDQKYKAAWGEEKYKIFKATQKAQKEAQKQAEK
ncbi:hypothetical protein L1S35_01105 [Flavobacterium sp. AS60]|uniref:hypothetical protein n=1 Tax=Flavobacterium anseongense TaxID=2910677 RepID=UPI001F35AA89|nr:hypothetical protein [Flavobacterium sp. AS60]MCF6128253.1 hypothetical protein [Flavobacterium sp. AS60]